MKKCTFSLHKLPKDLRRRVLGDMSGLELMKKIKASHPGTECIILTGHASQTSAIEAINLGDYGYVQKPYEIEQLLVTIQKAIEKRETEDALRESKERYYTLFEAVPVGLYRTTPKGQFLDANLALARMLGYPDPETLLTINAVELYVDSKERERWKTEMEANGVVHNFEAQWFRYDKTAIWVRDSARTIHNEQGRTLYYDGAVEDITESKQAEKKIRRRNRELALLNRIIAASVSSLEQETVLETVCRELALAFDVPQATATLLNMEKTVATIIAEYRTEGRPTALHQTIPINNSPSFQYLLEYKAPLTVNNTRQDPHLAPIHKLMCQQETISLLILPLIIKGEVVGSLGLEAIKLRPFLAEEINLALSVADQVAGALARFRLDKERQQLEEQYRQSQKMEAVGQLAGGIAHDFNNLLTGIMGHAGLAMRALPPGNPIRADLESIQKNADRAANLTRQLLAFARKQIIHPTVLDPNSLILSLDKMLRRLISEDIELVTLLASGLGWVKADPGQLEQILLNLAVNARDAMPDGGKLTIETANVALDQNYTGQHAEVIPGEYVMLAVSDTGVGMTEKVKARIFEPFFTTKEVGKGTGLGLATVFGIVKQSNGYIWVYSEPGRGTSFKIYLPRIKTMNSLNPVSDKTDNLPRGTETVLVVEDEVSVRTLAARTLSQQGYTVLEAANGEEALHLIQDYSKEIQLLLTDMVMPKMGGKILADQLTALRPKTKILFTSGYTDEAITHHGTLDAGVMFLQKPFSPKILVHKVRQVLDTPQPEER